MQDIATVVIKTVCLLTWDLRTRLQQDLDVINGDVALPTRPAECFNRQLNHRKEGHGTYTDSQCCGNQTMQLLQLH